MKEPKITKQYLKKNFPDCEIVFSKGYHYFSGFIVKKENKEHIVYFCSRDDRNINPTSWGYIRTAKHLQDFYGGENNHIRTANDLVGRINYLFTNEMEN